MGTKTGKKNYMEIFLSTLLVDLYAVGASIASVRALLKAHASTIHFGTLIDGGKGLRAGGVFKFIRDGEEMWDGVPSGTASGEWVSVGYDTTADNPDYEDLNEVEGLRMYGYQLDSKTGLAKRIGLAPVYVEETSEGNTQETFAVKMSETGEKADLWQRKILPLTTPIP